LLQGRPWWLLLLWPLQRRLLLRLLWLRLLLLCLPPRCVFLVGLSVDIPESCLLLQ
jgi:hypothetical protein